MDLLISLVFLLLIITAILIIKIDKLNKFTKSLMHISTYTNILVTIGCMYYSLIKSDLGYVIHNIGQSIVNGNSVFGSLCYLILLNTLLVIVIFLNLNLNNIILDINDNKILNSIKIYSIYCLILPIFFILAPIIQYFYNTNLLNMLSNDCLSKLSILYCGFIQIVIVLNLINIIIFNHFTKRRDVKQNLIKDLSEEDLKKIKKFNFGAFFLTNIWGIFNKSYGLVILNVVLGFIPIISKLADFIMPFVFGIKGNKLAFKNNYYVSVNDFNKHQNLYTFIGIISFIINLILYLMILVYIWKFSGLYTS